MALKEVAKDIKSALALEQELQISYAQKGVSVLDVYSAEWGPCKAISETFRRLYTEADAVHLRFFTVDCNAILESLKTPTEEARHQRPKNTEAIKDTLPEAWQPLLTERLGKSKPYFLFYKEGKRASFVDGVNTPMIRAIVKDLCTVKTPASEFITHVKLQEMWDEYFNPEESEVSFEKFLKALTAVCKLTVSLNEEEKAVLLEAIGVAKDAKDKTVYAEGLQRWMGEDEGRTVLQAFTETLPDYEERAVQVRIEREAEARRRAEDEEKRRVEEERQEQERKDAEEKARREEEERAAKEATPEEKVRTLDLEIAELLPTVPEADGSTEKLAEGDAQRAVRYAATADNSEKAARYPLSTAMDAAKGAEAAAAALEKIKGAVSLGDELVQKGVALLTVSAVRDELHTRFYESALSGNAKLAAALLSCATEDSKALTDNAVDVDFTAAGVVVADWPALLATAASQLSVAAPAEVLEWVGETVPKDGDTVVLPPLTALYTSAPSPASGKSVNVTGVANVIDSAAFSRYPGQNFVLTPWFITCKVSADAEGNVKMTAEGPVSEDDFNSVCAAFSSGARENDTKLSNIASIQLKKAERDEAAAKLPPSEDEPKAAEPAPVKKETPPAAATPEEDKKKSPSPTEEKKPATPPADEKKPATPPAEEKKAATPEEKPAELPKEEAKPAEEPKADSPPPAEEKAAEPAPAAEEAPKAATPPQEEEAKPATPPQKSPTPPADDVKPVEEAPAPADPVPADPAPADPAPADPAPADPAPADPVPADPAPAEPAPAAADPAPAAEAKPAEEPAAASPAEEKPAEEEKKEPEWI